MVKNGHMDGHTTGHTNGWKIGSLYCAMLETKMVVKYGRIP